MEKYIVIDRRESLSASILADAWTFGLLALCIWLSKGDAVWTSFNIILLLALAMLKISWPGSDKGLSFNDVHALGLWALKEVRADKGDRLIRPIMFRPSTNSIAWRLKTNYPIPSAVAEDLIKCYSCHAKHKMKDRVFSESDDVGYSLMLCPHCRDDSFLPFNKEVS